MIQTGGPRILLVACQEGPAAVFREALEKSGFLVSAAAGPSPWRAWVVEQPDLTILGPGLRPSEVFDWCRRVRRLTDRPLVALVPVDEEVTRVVALEVGADDVLAPDVEARELVACARAHLRARREHAVHGADDDCEAAPLQVGELLLSLAERRAWRGTEPLLLKRRELDLLACLMENRGAVLSRSQLLKWVWGGEGGVGQRTVDIHIHRVRRKIERNPRLPEYLHTIRGLGYVLRR
jgi:two-component system OmpR family response regulator/two-component system alkaline phosphatase synthesis response regulator PhoP